jgi:hypothetical protein
MGVLFATRRMVVRGKPELLTNGDFESYTGTQDNGVDDTLTGWTNTGLGAGDIIEATATVHTGTNAIKLTYGNDGCLVTQQRTVVPGQRYNIVLWSRGDAIVGGRYGVWDVTNGAHIISPAATGNTTATYARVQAAFTVPVGCIAILMRLLSATANGDVYFDDVSVRLA